MFKNSNGHLIQPEFVNIKIQIDLLSSLNNKIRFGSIRKTNHSKDVDANEQKCVLSLP